MGSFAKTAVGTYLYTAPEIIKNLNNPSKLKDYNKTVDVYSYGLTIYMLWTEIQPKKVTKGLLLKSSVLDMTVPELKNCPSLITHLITKCSKQKSTSRYASFKDILIELDPIKKGL